MRVHQIMTRKVTTVKADTPILEAANLMLRRHMSGLPVVGDTGKLVGIVSEGDFIRRSEIGTQRKRGRWLKILVGPALSASEFVHEQGSKVGEIMTRDLCTTTEDMLLEDVVRLMECENVKRLPVVRG
ncbi:MAG TPA: CBS domain-containing protein, partial [Bradyrhizobium sp.]